MQLIKGKYQKIILKNIKELTELCLDDEKIKTTLRVFTSCGVDQIEVQYSVIAENTTFITSDYKRVKSFLKEAL